MTKESKSAREYLVFLRTDADTLELVGKVHANGAHSAIRAKATEDGQYVAVPRGNWTELLVEREEREPILRLTELSVEQPRLPLAVVEGEADGA